MTKFSITWFFMSIVVAFMADIDPEIGTMERLGFNPTLMIAGLAGTFFKVAHEVYPGWKTMALRLLAGICAGNYLGMFLADKLSVTPIFAGFLAGFGGILIVTYFQGRYFPSEKDQLKKAKK